MVSQAQDNLIKTDSWLTPADWLTPPDIQEAIDAARAAALEAAFEELGQVNVVVRPLFASDFGAVSTNSWLEATAGTTWADSAFANGSQVADNVFIAIYGAQWQHEELSAGEGGGFNPAVTALRIAIGGARVAQWDLNVIYRGQNSAGTPANAYGSLANYPVGIATSPVVLTQNKGATVQFLERAATLNFTVVLLGLVVEPVGGGGAALVP